MISSHVKTSCLITFLFCPFNYTKICWCMIETSSNLLRSSSAIFGNLRCWNCLENVRQRSSGLRNNFGKSSENFGKWSEIFGKSSKTASSVRLYHKRNIGTLARRYEFYVLVASSCHSNMEFISSHHRVISSLTAQCLITD